MARLLFWILLLGLAYLVVKNWSRASARRMEAGDKPAEAIVACAVCGLNVPQSEAHAHDGKWYCSREHLERARTGS